MDATARTSRAGRRAGGEAGTTLVEFAFVFPILALLMFGLADLCLVLIGNSVGSNAAQEGARVGILEYEDADTSGSATNTRIVAAVNAKLAGLVRGGAVDAVEVRCYNGDTATPVLVSCELVDVTRGDLIEVLVRWKHIGATPFVANLTHSDRARMVILGKPNTVNTPPPAVTPVFSISDVTVPEGDTGTVDATFIVSGAPMAGTVSVSYATADGTAKVDDGDYVASSGQLTFADGVTSQTVTIKVNGDTVDEPLETFAVGLSAPVGANLGDASGLGTITNDDAPTDTVAPTVQLLEMFDVNANGKVDRVVITFNENLGACPGTAGLTFVNAPSGATLGAITKAGDKATIAFNEGAGAHDTAVGSFRLTLSPNANGLCDAAGNQAQFSALAPQDKAGPKPVAIGEASNATDGKLEVGDAISFTFSEPVNGVPGLATITEKDNNKIDSLDIIGITNAATSLGSEVYVDTSKSASFAGTVALDATGKIITVTAGACSGDCGKINAGVGDFTFTASPGIKDAAGNSSVGSIFQSAFRAF